MEYYVVILEIYSFAYAWKKVSKQIAALLYAKLGRDRTTYVHLLIYHQPLFQSLFIFINWIRRYFQHFVVNNKMGEYSCTILNIPAFQLSG